MKLCKFVMQVATNVSHNILKNHAIQLQLCKNNYFATLMQLVCDYHGIVMMMSIFINPSKFDMWHYGIFWVILKIYINLHHPL
jgi:hypothetical protein